MEGWPVKIERYKCPECTGLLEVPEDNDAEVYCEDCGSHPGFKCPHCEEMIDLIFAEDFPEPPFTLELNDVDQA